MKWWWNPEAVFFSLKKNLSELCLKSLLISKAWNWKQDKEKSCTHGLLKQQCHDSPCYIYFCLRLIHWLVLHNKAFSCYSLKLSTIHSMLHTLLSLTESNTNGLLPTLKWQTLSLHKWIVLAVYGALPFFSCLIICVAACIAMAFFLLSSKIFWRKDIT